MSLATQGRVGPASEVEALWFRAATSRPARSLILEPERPGEPARRVPWDELLGLARGAARGLAASGSVQPGAPFLLVAASELDVIRALLGGVLLGALPVPVHPPLGLGGLEAWREHLQAVGRAVGATAVVGRGATLALLPEADLPCVACEELPLEGDPFPDVAPGEAYVQLTSGSTAHPKGVLVEHAALAANVHMIGWSVGVRGEDRVVSWLPLYHDMGLVGTLLFALYWNLDLALLTPFAFLARPARWLEAISRHRGTLSPAPCFAFSYVAHRVREAELAGLDLGSWRVAFCGAEPIQPAAVRRFQARLAPYGLDPGAVFPCYGLAEATLAVTFGPAGRGPVTRTVSRRALTEEGLARAPGGDEDALELVLNGRALPELAVEVRDEDGRPLPAGRAGAVWVRGASVTRAYLEDGRRREAQDERGFLDTGDLGCWLDGELAVIGRRKDLIIVRGRNHAPIDLEWAAEEVPGVRPGSVAAFAVPDPAEGTEAAVVACEVAAELSDWSRGAIACAVQEAVLRRAGLRPLDVVLLAPGAVPRTTSGKVQRARARLRYLDGTLGSEPA